MAKFKLAAGAELEALTSHELRAELMAQEQRNREPSRAVSVIDLPVLFGQASGGVLSMGGDTQQPLQAPQSGYVWSVRHISIEGLTAGATPDVVNIIRRNRTFWKLSGGPPSAETWGRGEFILRAGMSLAYTNFGTFAATGQIIVSGTVWQAPEEFVAELGL